MTTTQATERSRQVLRRQHKALATEDGYTFRIRWYIRALRHTPTGIPSEQKLERFLMELAFHGKVDASTQNQAFNGDGVGP